jgi:hypothetical protein
VNQQGLGAASPGQAAILGDDQPAPGGRDRHQLLVTALAPEFGVVAGQPQPARELAKHGVDHQAWCGGLAALPVC